MDGEKITGVTIDATETPGIGDAAIEPLIEQIMEAQSADIAGVSGATVTSTAVKDAIAKALEEAAAGGAEAAEEGEASEGDPTPGTYTCQRTATMLPLSSM